MTDYTQKYLKYKKKYFNLKNQYGGNWICNNCGYNNDLSQSANINKCYRCQLPQNQNELYTRTSLNHPQNVSYGMDENHFLDEHKGMSAVKNGDASPQCSLLDASVHNGSRQDSSLDTSNYADFLRRTKIKYPFKNPFDDDDEDESYQGSSLGASVHNGSHQGSSLDAPLHNGSHQGSSLDASDCGEYLRRIEIEHPFKNPFENNDDDESYQGSSLDAPAYRGYLRTSAVKNQFENNVAQKQELQMLAQQKLELQRLSSLKLQPLPSLKSKK
jgi:hypothetical protein